MFTKPFHIASLLTFSTLMGCGVESPEEQGEQSSEVESAKLQQQVIRRGSRIRVIAKNKSMGRSLRARTAGKSKTGDRSLDRALKRHAGMKLEPLFPYSKNPKLLEVFEVTCPSCDSLELKDELEQTGAFSDVRELAQPTLTAHGNPGGYDPADWMWSAHAQDWMWHLVQTKVDLAWNMTKGDPAVQIAVVDAGFDPTHVELEGKLNTLDPRTEDPLGNHTHGTATAAMAAGETAEAGDQAEGSMPSAGFHSSVHGLMWGGTAGAHHAALAMDVDVINISWFTNCSPDPTGIDQLAIQEILDAGTSIVVAAANGPAHCGGGPTYPFNADYDERIIVVTSTGKTDAHGNGADTHSHYPAVDLAAPGYNVMVATQGNNWGYFGSANGTSFAAPQVAAATALMKSVNSCLQPDDVQRILKNSTDPILDARDPAYLGQVGTGRLNTNRAVALAHAEKCPAGGSFDGANCYLGSPPEGTNAFKWGGNYYYTPLPGNSCPMEGSWYDGANCYVQEIPEGVQPFIHANKWYYSDCSTDGWTEWSDIDNASGSGDYELLSALSDVCSVPVAIQCRATDGTYFTQTSDDVVRCDKEGGFSCVNSEQADGSCEDYEVRFFCPDGGAVIPETPSATSPVDGEWVPFGSQSSYSVDLTFQPASTDADSYEVRLFIESPTGTPVFSTTVQGTGSWLTASAPVELHRDYYWQVRAVSSAGSSEWTEAEHFFPALVTN